MGQICDGPIAKNIPKNIPKMCADLMLVSSKAQFLHIICWTIRIIGIMKKFTFDLNFHTNIAETQLIICEAYTSD